ncbi:MAG: histidine kinase dimerization/phospho-acceptor domain-containing protein, partial [Novosphingobium sp.]
IEAYRKRKAEAGLALAEAAPTTNPSASAAASVEAFAFTCDERGRINWAEPSVAPATIGLRIGTNDAASAVVSTAAVVEAFRRRQPIRGGRLGISGAPSVAGAWQLDANPAFDHLGHFIGYRGRFRRPAAQEASPRAAADSNADRVRQLLHELRTPVNAIQGFAEVIQQQLFGPTPHEYRAHAAAIAGDAARMLAGFEEMDRLARLDAGAMTLDPGTCDMAAIVHTLIDQLNAHLGQRSSGFDLALDPGVLAVDLDAGEAERLCWRLLATMAGLAAPGERLKVRLRRKHQMIRLTSDLPGALSIKDDLFHASPPPATSALSAGMFGAGFALRLAAAEARAAGGDLVRRDARIRLELPEAAGDLTAPAPDHNQQEGFAG